MPPHQAAKYHKGWIGEVMQHKTSHNGVNNMWILKNSTSLLSSLDQLDVRTAKSVQTFDFSMLYTSIPHDLLKSRISNLVHNAFRKKDGSVRYTHIKLTRAKGYFTHDINGGGDNMFTADSICEMIEFLIDKRDDFDFHIVNFPFLSSNIPSGPSYGVYISQLIRYAQCCSHYDDFRYRHKCLVDRLLSQGYKALRLEKSFKKLWQISRSH